MEVVTAVSPPSFITRQPVITLHHKRNSSFSLCFKNKSKSKFNNICVSTQTQTTTTSYPEEKEEEKEEDDEKFEWFCEWYALMPVCDLDKRAPHGKTVMGLDVVIWWDKKNNAWKVFDDTCPHRLAPLSQGRIDEKGRLQCVYHGWCFGATGDCKFIPQAPINGPQAHKFPKACVGVYPSTVQNGIVWFWPSTDPEYKDILNKRKPPHIPELDDPSFTFQMFHRDLPYGYEILMENLMDPAHVPYAHYGIVSSPPPSVKLDREGGRPLDITINKIYKNGFSADQSIGQWNFVPPCLLYSRVIIAPNNGTTKEQLSQRQPPTLLTVFFCMPVSPGNSRVIIITPRNFGVWIDRIVPRWMFHIGQNLILDSDLYLLHVEEKRVFDAGISNWHNACFVPTKSDAIVVAFRKWLKKYSDGQVKFDGSLPPTPPREVLMDRYWSHVVNCSSCNAAYNGLNVVEFSLQVLSLVLVVILAAKRKVVGARNTLAVAAVLCFVGSKWLSRFVYKNFRYHDYNHPFPETNLVVTAFNLVMSHLLKHFLSM